MPSAFALNVRRGLARAADTLRRPQLMVFLPAATLAAFWIGGERTLLAVALGLPLLFSLAGAFSFRQPAPAASDAILQLPRQQITERLDRALRLAQDAGLRMACMVAEVDGRDIMLARHGRTAQAEALQRTAERIGSALRNTDIVSRMDSGGIAITIAPVRRLDLETLIQIAARIQAAARQPVLIDGLELQLSISVGFCHSSRVPEPSGQALLDSAQLAADEALRHGPGGIRAFAPDMIRQRQENAAMRAELEAALDHGQIVAFFQPQISADTGGVTGFEALVRWQHPTRGLLLPADFLGELTNAGLSERLSEVMVFQALSALSRWDAAGTGVPAVSVNFSSDELRNPRLAEKLKWDLDRFELAPGRLSVEILETVMADADDDIVVQNIAAIARMGCGIDLDDFGTGNTSIANIRRFSVRRLKIDRSFINRIDEDEDRRKIVAAILSMSEQLGVETIAEGVETRSEHALLAQLGCTHLQGFGIGRPMPADEAATWLAAHRSRLAVAPQIGKRASKA